MQSPFGPFLRQLRLSRGLSQAQAAQLASIGRVTLSRWETHVQQPRIWELESFFNALQIEPGDRQQAFKLLGTTEARNHIQSEISLVAEQKGYGPQPNGGDLLRALRLRQGLSQEAAAQRIGVTVRTLRRWERAESWPALHQLHTLCYVLGAHSEELLALTDGGIQLEPEGDEMPTLEELHARCHMLHHYSSDKRSLSLRELGFISLEAKAWPVAAHSSLGQQALSHIYSCHANYYCAHGRYTEGKYYASRALDSWPADVPPSRGMIQAAIALATASVYSGARPNPQRGITLLLHWVEAALWPPYRAWLLSDMASYFGLEQDADVSLVLARQASDVATYCEKPYELHLRQLDEAQLLIKAGRFGQAMTLIERERPELQPEHLVKFLFLETEVWLAMNRSSRAHVALQTAVNLLDNWPLEHLRPRAGHLSELI